MPGLSKAVNEFCTNHPKIPAYWKCNSCDVLLCPDCVEERQVGTYQQSITVHCCTKCTMPAESLGAADKLKPFWKRPLQLLIYPFTLWPLLINLVLCAVSLVSTKFSLLGQLLNFLIWITWLTYSFAAMKATANGVLSAPKPDKNTLLRDIHQLLIQPGIFLAIVAAASWFQGILGIVVFTLVAMAAFLYTPAIIIRIVVTNNILEAVHYTGVIELKKKIGQGYVLMYLFLLLLGCLPTVIVWLAIMYSPINMELFFLFFAHNLYMLTAYHLLGYVILQYSDTLGYKGDSAALRDSGKDSGTAETVQTVDILTEQGDLDAALAMIEEETQGENITDVELSERYYQLLKSKAELERMQAYSLLHLSLLVKTAEKSRACGFYMDCVSEDSGFMPDENILFKMGLWLTEAGKFETAIEAYGKILNVYPECSLIPMVYFRSAQLLCERFDDTGKTREILDYLIDTYPHHEIMPYVKQYLTRIDS